MFLLFSLVLFPTFLDGYYFALPMSACHFFLVSPPHANGKKSNTKVEYIRERGVWSFAAAKRLGEYYTIMYGGGGGLYFLLLTLPPLLFFHFPQAFSFVVEEKRNKTRHRPSFSHPCNFPRINFCFFFLFDLAKHFAGIHTGNWQF